MNNKKSRTSSFSPNRVTQKAKQFDQTSKEVPRGKMGRLVEAIAERIWNRNQAHSSPEGKSTAHKVCQAKNVYQHGEISRATKVFTNVSKPTSDPDRYECLRLLFPPPSAAYDSPLQMREYWPEHCPPDIEINDSWDTPQTFERIVKCHSTTALTKYISGRAPSYTSQTLMDGEWRFYSSVSSCHLTQIMKILRY